jgi:molecular chaperone IbpA
MTGLALLEASLSALPHPCCFKEDMAMATTNDYAPLYRSSVGFDRVFNLLENAQRARSISDWPPYDIVKTGDDSYRISIAVAGFAQDDLDITFQSNLLTVTGKKQEHRRWLPASRHCRPAVRTPVRACRPCQGEWSGSEQRSPVDRSRSRDPGLKPRRSRSRASPPLTSAAPAQISAEGRLIHISAEQGRRGDGARQHSGLGRRER